MANRILAALAVLLALAASSQVHAAQVVSITPAAPQAYQQIFVNVALTRFEPIDKRTVVHQNGNRIALVLFVDDTVDPFDPPPPLQDRTETFAIGAFPAGNYQFELYLNGPGQPFLADTVPLGVAAATPVPILGARGVVLLALLVAGIGCGLIAHAHRPGGHA